MLSGSTFWVQGLTQNGLYKVGQIENESLREPAGVDPIMSKTVNINVHHVTRVEGHGKVTIHLDDQNNVDYTRLHIVEFRGFERFVQGRPYFRIARI